MPEASMTLPPDENLPEVVPAQPFEVDRDAAPQVLSQSEKANHEWYASDRDKYHVTYDNTPKLVDDGLIDKLGTLPPQPWSPESLTAASPATAADPNTLPGGDPPNPDRTICGLKRRTFFIALFITSILLLG